ncbi:MAG TPA: GAF domain-containing protein, partial [Bacteroidetes bacterium]|nr:GAF domain-containing protein [Bacteroidota bacterium]
ILHSAREMLHAEAASLFLVNRRRHRLELTASTNIPPSLFPKIHFPVGEGVAGWVAEHGETVHLDDLTVDSRYVPAVDSQIGLNTRGYICVPLVVNRRVIGTLHVLNRSRGAHFTEEDRELLEGFAVVAALAIHKSRMHEVALEKRRLDAELQVAKEFQQRLLPVVFLPPAPLRIAGQNRPAREIGGDLYDGFAVDDGYCVLIGDVSGKGPGAALWMAGLSHLLRYSASRGADPLEELPSIDLHLCKVLPTETFITLFIAIIRPDGTFRYVSAGHSPMLLIRPRDEVLWLRPTGPALGILPELPRKIREERLPRGSRLILFTDGITEAVNREGWMYGDKRVERISLRHRNESPEQILQALLRSVTRFSNGAEPGDDITLLVIAS